MEGGIVRCLQGRSWVPLAFNRAIAGRHNRQVLPSEPLERTFLPATSRPALASQFAYIRIRLNDTCGLGLLVGVLIWVQPRDPIVRNLV